MDIFVYGTLRSHALFRAVAGPGSTMSIEARILDYVVRPVANHVVPFIRKAAGSQATGLIWQDLNDDQVGRLDAYEGAFGYELIDVVVEVASQLRTAKMYLPPDDIKEASHEWSLQDWENEHLRPACLTAEELFSSDQIPSSETIRKSWPMVEKRAWAKYRAENEKSPTTVRSEQTTKAVQIHPNAPQVGAFYRMQDFEITHESFNGSRLGPLQREAFIGIDASVVLPYDPKRDRVLLIEQLRMGPLIRNDPHPWSLEPIAGMIDARETPEGAARREVKEEAGLDPIELIFVSGNYPSPGSATDYFYCYVGLCDLVAEQSYISGVVSEAEDLRVHTLPYAKAMQLLESGEIATGPLVMLLFWLSANRDRLRATA